MRQERHWVDHVVVNAVLVVFGAVAVAAVYWRLSTPAKPDTPPRYTTVRFEADVPDARLVLNDQGFSMPATLFLREDYVHQLVVTARGYPDHVNIAYVPPRREAAREEHVYRVQFRKGPP
jgi:uncharacterized membrane protein